MSTSIFECDRCGSCCRLIGKILSNQDNKKISAELIEEYKKFPYPINKDGSCSMLKENRCTVFVVRPLVCNSERVYRTFYSKTISKQEAIAIHEKGCIKIKEWNKNEK
jgi:Fe-S-cluster containining protein